MTRPIPLRQIVAVPVAEIGGAAEFDRRLADLLLDLEIAVDLDEKNTAASIGCELNRFADASGEAVLAECSRLLIHAILAARNSLPQDGIVRIHLDAMRRFAEPRNRAATPGTRKILLALDALLDLGRQRHN